MSSLTGVLLASPMAAGLLLMLLALLAVWFFWYRGGAAPLTAGEVSNFLEATVRHGLDADDPELLVALRRLLADDDGREFVMVNLIRYRERALYPAGSPYGDSAVAADRRYARALFPYLLRHGNIPIFIARRRGDFIEPAGATPWQVVAMIRYRSKRDFVRTFSAVMDKNVMLHKWAAISVTHVFPVQPLFSLISLRLTGLLLRRE